MGVTTTPTDITYMSLNSWPCVYVVVEQDCPNPLLRNLSLGLAGGHLLRISKAKFYLNWDEFKHAHPAICAALEAPTRPTIILSLNSHMTDVLKALGENADLLMVPSMDGYAVPRHVVEKWYRLIDGNVPHREGMGPAEYWRATLAEILEEKLYKRA